MKKVKIFLRNHIESIFIIVFSSILTLSVYLFFKESYVNLYIKTGLNLVLIEVFGGLLGLMLTAYAILFGLIPSLEKDFLDSNTFNRLNKRFVYTILSNLLLLILGISINFIDVTTFSLIVFIHLFLMMFSFSMISLLTIYLYFLFKMSKKKVLND